MENFGRISFRNLFAILILSSLMLACENPKYTPLSKNYHKPETGRLSIPIGDDHTQASAEAPVAEGAETVVPPAEPESSSGAPATTDSPSSAEAELAPQHEEIPDPPPFDNPNTPVATGIMEINEEGILEGSGVHKDLNLKNGSYTGGKPKGIILHKTGGYVHSCRSNNTVPNKAPHIYICRDGRVIVNGSFDHPRSAAEKGHHDWSLNIEFDAIYIKDKSVCDRRPELTWGQPATKKATAHWGHCYEAITDAQVKTGREVMALLSKKYKIPLALVHDVKTQEDYVSQGTNVLRSGKYGKHSSNPSNMKKGVLPSYWTALDRANILGKDGVGNHDDGVSWNEMIQLGIVNSSK